LAIGCDWQGYFDKATEYFNRALTGLESSLGQEHPHTLAVLNNMAAVFIEQQDYDKSMERLLELKRSFRKDHPETLAVLSNMAIVYTNQRKYDKAMECFGRSLLEWNDLPGKNILKLSL
jgi:tetratricopeptide (TPR) repeat protein